jgi:hypothetical protein
MEQSCAAAAAPILDVKTKNESFLVTYRELRSLGVKNCAFFLALHDPELVGVDPHSAKLSDIVKARIMREVKVNPWYYYREVVRIPVAGGLKRFCLHRGNLAELWCLHRNLNAIELLPRQNFKTVSACCFYAYAYDFGTTNSTFLFVNKEYTDSKKNLKILKELRGKLPKWMQLREKGDQDNVEFIASARTGNSIRPLSSANDTESAEKRGRGMTSSNQWLTN